MLLRFGVQNHRSIRDYQEISFLASSLKDNEEGLLSIDLPQDNEADDDSAGMKLSVLPVVAVYGANAAGKSTILKAFDFFYEAILNSHTGTAKTHGTPYTPYLLNDYSIEEPSGYDADFVIDGTRYHYGFTVDGKIIVSEWLYSFNLSSKRQVRSVLFHRDSEAEEIFYFGPALKGDNKRISKSVRANSLYLSTAAQNAHPHLSLILEYFSENISTRLEQLSNPAAITKQLIAYFGKDPDRKKVAFEFLKAADVGITDIDFSEIPYEEKTKKLLSDFETVIKKHLPTMSLENSFNVKTEAKVLHSGEDEKSYPIELEYESSGTLALLQILGPVFNRLLNGGVLLVDELNICLHPLVSKQLIKLFSYPETNPGRAQLIFSTHDTGMLTGGSLRRDQIWFVEKDRVGASTLYPLSNFKVRSTDNFEKGYKDGRFGAAPDFNLFQARFGHLLRSSEKRGDE